MSSHVVIAVGFVVFTVSESVLHRKSDHKTVLSYRESRSHFDRF